MQKNKKIVIIFIIVIIIIAILFSVYTVLSSYLFKPDYSIPDGKSELIEHLKQVNDVTERKKQVDFSVEQNLLTQEEANELY